MMQNLAHLTDIALEGRRTGPAVYAVEHVASGRRLICSTTCFSRRLWDQRTYLARQRHYNPALQADLERDGAAAFRILLIDLPDDRRQLHILRRLRIEEARRAGGCYNAPDPPNRQVLSLSPDDIGNTIKRLLDRVAEVRR